VSKEIPILFSGAMVRAILEGRKTVTRRVIKDQPPTPGQYKFANPPYKARFNELHGKWWIVPLDVSDYDPSPYELYEYNPKYVEGMRLWVRETFVDLRPHQDRYGYKATDLDIVTKWRPSIFMPRWASRITLEVVSVRPERLHDITEDDAKAEGVWTDSTDMRMLSSSTKNHVGAFARLWDEINEKRGYSWGSNPWIWRVEFKRI